ncbi:MAG TPA: NADH:flavin oxidoreductase/NADH oxidase [Gemmatimonadaceae bacterium]|nr:NADH:flavin oxidoreductase/NADH oxidase [Gemmatimonadaceae bacterium]
MSALFDPLKLRDVTLPNRIVVSPMCQYSSTDGVANDWHFVHLGSRAIGGAGLVFTEATAVTANGRISPFDMGLWRDTQIEPLARIVRFIHAHGSVAGMQLAHAGRKASTVPPWEGMRLAPPAEGGWTDVVAPSALPYSDASAAPREMTREDISTVVAAFARAARRTLQAEYRVLEIHAAHGYLLHEFFSPLSNLRTDEYGGSFENRTRIAREVIAAVRRVWPEHLPLFVRISATDWADNGWDIEQSVELARTLKSLGVDLIDCSTGGNVHGVRIPTEPGYQVPFAERVRRDADIATGAVGLITEPRHADEIVREGKADVVLLAREMLRDPYFPLRAARELGVPMPWPVQYLRGAPPDSTRR